MKIGMYIGYNPYLSESIKHIWQSTIEVLKQSHDLIFPTLDYWYSSVDRQREMLREMMLSSDVILSGIDKLVLQVRQSLDIRIPYVCFMFGELPRGARGMRQNYSLFRTTDILIGNCASDLTIAHKFFENAQIRLLPFAFRESDFYPLDEISKQTLRAKFGLRAEDKILLYSGRITLEKNVHTILRVFGAIQQFVPNARLIVAGEESNIPFVEFNAHSLGIGRMLRRAITKLGLNKDDIKFVGNQDKAGLRGLYNIADVVVNLTLHHDENFGLAQVEAMVCGTPVIGTNWGGLKDTIVDGETGYKVGTTVTASGVKLSWWEAVNKIVMLLSSSPEYLQLRQKCRDSAYRRYSLSKYRENLESILASCQEKEEGRGEPLLVSEFAQQLWNSYTPVGGETAVYKHGVSPFQMYRELIAPYTGTIPGGVAANQRLKPCHVLCLAAPLSQADENSFEINDPIFPLKITVPSEHTDVVFTVIEAMREEPAITFGRLTKEYLAGQVGVVDALEWMIDAGLVIKNEPETEVISPRNISPQMSVPLFSIQSLKSSIDIATIR